MVFDRGVGPEEPKLIILSVSVEVDQSLRPQPGAFHSRVVPALAQSITTGQLADTKVYLYTRHSGQKSACMPLPSYLNSAIVFEFGCSDLNDLCKLASVYSIIIESIDMRKVTAEGFKDTAMVAIDAYTLKQEDQCVNNYDYDSDSDLEEEDEQGLSAYVEVNCHKHIAEHNAGLIPSMVKSRRKKSLASRKPQMKIKMNPRSSSILCLSTILVHSYYTGANTLLSRKVQASTRTRFLRIGRVLVIRNTAFRT